MTVTTSPPMSGGSNGTGNAARELEFPAKPAAPLSRKLLTVTLVVVLALAVWSVDALDISIATFVRGYTNAVDFLGRTVPFTFPSPGELWMMIGQTLAIVVLATVLGFVLSLPMALLAASNTTPHPVVRHIARVAVVLLRAVPDFVIAVFLVRVFGLGTLPGILALGVGSVGMMGKLYSDAIEEIDPAPCEALRTAATPAACSRSSGVLPQIRPQLVATALHGFDINLRGSVLLGFVGVSGIGMYISAALETLNYPRGMGLTLVLLILCLLAELVSGLLRRQMLGAKGAVAAPPVASAAGSRHSSRSSPHEDGSGAPEPRPRRPVRRPRPRRPQPLARTPVPRCGPRTATCDSPRPGTEGDARAPDGRSCSASSSRCRCWPQASSWGSSRGACRKASRPSECTSRRRRPASGASCSSRWSRPSRWAWPARCWGSSWRSPWAC